MGSALEVAMTAIISGDKNFPAARALTKRQVVIMGHQSSQFSAQTHAATKAVVLQKTLKHLNRAKAPTNSGRQATATEQGQVGGTGQQSQYRSQDASTAAVQSATTTSGGSKPGSMPQPQGLPSKLSETKGAGLSMHGETQLLAFFSLQDTLSRTETAMLASRVGCSEEQVRQYFGKLRANVRAFIQRAHRRSWQGGASTPAAAHAAGQSRVSSAAVMPLDRPMQQDSGGGGGPSSGVTPGLADDPTTSSTPAPSAEVLSFDAMVAARDARKEAMARLRALLSDSGGVASPAAAGPFAAMMRTEKAVQLKLAMAAAIGATRDTSTLSQLVISGCCGFVFKRWLEEAESDRQQVVLREVLAAAKKLPWTLQQLRAGGLPTVVIRLQQQGAPSIATAAAAIAAIWRRLECPFLSTTSEGYIAAGKPIQKPTLALGLQRGSETSHPQRELSKKGGSSRAAPVPAGYVSRTSNTWTAADYAQFKEKPPTTSAAVPSANYSAHPKLVAAAKPAKTITASPSSSPSPLPPVAPKREVATAASSRRWAIVQGERQRHTPAHLLMPTITSMQSFLQLSAGQSSLLSNSHRQPVPQSAEQPTASGTAAAPQAAAATASASGQNGSAAAVSGQPAPYSRVKHGSLRKLDVASKSRWLKGSRAGGPVTMSRAAASPHSPGDRGASAAPHELEQQPLQEPEPALTSQVRKPRARPASATPPTVLPAAKVARTSSTSPSGRVMGRLPLGGRPGPKLPVMINTPQGQAAAATTTYKRSAQWLAHNAALWHKKMEEPLAAATVLRLPQMQATAGMSWHVPFVEVPLPSADMAPARGEDSLEVAIQEERLRNTSGSISKAVSEADEPKAPAAEPLSQQPPLAIPVIPFVPLEADEAQEQVP